MTHRLGFAVKALGGGGLPSHDTRRWQSGPHLRVSLERLGAVFDGSCCRPLRAHADLIDPIGFEAFLRGPPPGASST